MKSKNDSYSLFVDESGVADLTDYKYRHFLLIGVTIPNSEMDEVSGYFTFVKRRYTLQEDEPFHTYDLLENPNKKLPLAKAKQFVTSMCEFIDLIPLEITAIHCDKTRFRKDFKITTENLKGSKEAQERRGLIYYLSAYEQLNLYTTFLKEKNSLGHIHADSRTYQDTDLLQSFWDLKQTRTKKNKTNEEYQEAKKRLVSITFADKSAFSSGVQIADFVSFVLFSHLQRKISSFQDIGLNKVLRAIANKTGLKSLDLVESVGKDRIKEYL
jgi:hypothetical protein